MENGYIVVVRDREDGGIYVQLVDDWLEYMEEKPRRLIYCQAVCDMVQVQKKLDDMLEEYEQKDPTHSEANDQISELVEFVQWIANEHPLHSFRNVVV